MRPKFTHVQLTINFTGCFYCCLNLILLIISCVYFIIFLLQVYFRMKFGKIAHSVEVDCEIVNENGRKNETYNINMSVEVT